jgi:hypothetical protein
MKKLSLCILVVMICVFISSVQSQVISNIQFSPHSPSTILVEENLNITFDYSKAPADTILIFALPYNGNAPPPGFTVSPSLFYTDSSGSGSAWIRPPYTSANINKVLFQVTGANPSNILLEFFVPVDYHFSASTFSNIVMTPASPAPVQISNFIQVAFNYSSVQNVRIQALPYTDGAPTPHYAVTSSPLYGPGMGSGTASVTITDGDIEVDSIQLRMYSDDMLYLLQEMYIPVQYRFAHHGIADVRCDVQSPAALLNGQELNFTFKYTTTHSGGVLIFTRPYTDGELSPNYSASGGSACDSGDGDGVGNFTILSGDVMVDSIRFRMYNSNMDSVLLDYFVPVTYHFGSHSLSNIRFSPSSPAYFTTGRDDSCTFDYKTNSSGAVVIFARPFSNGALSPDYSAAGSFFLPTDSGSSSGHFTILTGDVAVDQMRFQMYDAALTNVLLEFFVPVDFEFKTRIPVGMETGGQDMPGSFSLLQNYPNPFNPNTTIEYSLPKQSHVTLRIYDVLGRELETIVNGIETPGNKKVKFDASRFSSGVYYYRLEAGSFVETKKFVLLK